MAPLTRVMEKNPITGKKQKINVPIIVRFQRISKLLQDDSEQARKYKKKLLGSSVVEVSTVLYDEIDLISSAGLITIYPEWEHWDIHTKAKIMAYQSLKSMIEIISRHDEYQKENLEKLGKK